jgi:hypothetical protein
VDKNTQFERTEGTPAVTCSEFDSLLSDALEGLLSAASQRRFDLHREQCPTCGPLFSETESGLNWLRSLDEVEAPANLVHNILAATTMQQAAAALAAPKKSLKERLSGVLADLVAPVRALVREPRLAMTGAMAMFSVTLSLNLVGVRLGDLKHVDLHPRAIKEQATMRYYETTSRVVKYYENIRLVYEVESRLQELKRATGSGEEQERPAERKKTENKKNQDERKQNYYSLGQGHTLLAVWSIKNLNNQNSAATRGTDLQCRTSRDQRTMETLRLGVKDCKNPTRSSLA